MHDHDDDQRPARQRPDDQPSDESRRQFLRTLGVAAAAAGGARVIGSGTGAAASTAPDPAGLEPVLDEGLGGGEELALDVVDYVDGYHVLDVRPSSQPRSMWTGTSRLRLSDGVQIEVLQGQAQISEDSGTGAILLRALAGDIVQARAIAPAGTVAARQVAGTETGMIGSPVVTVGYDAGEIPLDQVIFDAAGGGACRHFTSGAAMAGLAASMSMPVSPERLAAAAAVMTSGEPLELVVRAAVMGNVIPRTPSQREINWRHARYYGLSDAFGLLRFTYNKDFRSVVTMQGGEGSFFPATGVNSIYCRMEALDFGITAFNAEPMVLPSPSFTWPAYSTPMHLADPVTFYDEADPTQEVMTILDNEMKLYDYNGVDVRRLGAQISGSGTLSLGFEVRNQTDAPLGGRWLLIGDHTDREFGRADGALLLGPAGTENSVTTVNVTVPVRSSDLTQRVGFAVMSLSDPVVLGITPYSFRA